MVGRVVVVSRQRRKRRGRGRRCHKRGRRLVAAVPEAGREVPLGERHGRRRRAGGGTYV